MKFAEALEIYNKATKENIGIDFIFYPKHKTAKQCVDAIFEIITMYENLGGDIDKFSRQLIAQTIYQIKNK